MVIQVQAYFVCAFELDWGKGKECQRGTERHAIVRTPFLVVPGHAVWFPITHCVGKWFVSSLVLIEHQIQTIEVETDRATTTAVKKTSTLFTLV